MNEQMTPGQLLAAAREAKRLEPTDIAKEMRLSVQAIKDIEKDDYTNIGARTYIRGYLSTYARIVNISQAQVVALFDALVPLPELAMIPHAVVEGAPVTDVTRGDRRRFQYSPRTLLIAGGAVFLLLLIALLHHANENSSETKNTETTQTSTLMIAPPVQEADASETSVPTQQTFTKPVVVAPTSPAATGFVKRPASMAKVTYKVMPVYSKTSS